MKKLLCPSMMCADFGHLENEVRTLHEAGADIFHCDVMDGNFVPNFTMGIPDIQAIRKYTDKLIDCHLMIENPGDKIDWFINIGVNIIYIHPESERYVIKTLTHMKKKGIAAGLAINPDTSVTNVSELLYLCDYVMVMTVNPGFAGQDFIDFTINKIKKLIELKKQFHYKLMIDGHCTPEVIQKMSMMGVDGFILGTSSLFIKGHTYADTLRSLRGG